jgi:DNA-binding transcriptional regulator of glucitol operon
VRSVRRFLLSPKWWVGHVLVALAVAVFLALGGWQYDRSQSAVGDFQNLGYALQWPLFAVFAVCAWWRVLRLEQRRLEQGHLEQGHFDQRHAGSELAPPTSEPSPPPRPALYAQPVQEDDPDDELAAYNAHLARLATRDAQR